VGKEKQPIVNASFSDIIKLAVSDEVTQANIAKKGDANVSKLTVNGKPKLVKAKKHDIGRDFVFTTKLLNRKELENATKGMNQDDCTKYVAEHAIWSPTRLLSSQKGRGLSSPIVD